MNERAVNFGILAEQNDFLIDKITDSLTNDDYNLWAHEEFCQAKNGASINTPPPKHTHTHKYTRADKKEKKHYTNILYHLTFSHIPTARINSYEYHMPSWITQLVEAMQNLLSFTCTYSTLTLKGIRNTQLLLFMGTIVMVVKTAANKPIHTQKQGSDCEHRELIIEATKGYLSNRRTEIS